MKIIVENEAGLSTVIDALVPILNTHQIIAFDAEMGAGKTTLISKLISKLSDGEEVSSPTFGYVKDYQTQLGTIHHFDLYRLNEEEEAYDIGIEEYLYGENICLIEWPRKIENLLPENTVWVNIAVDTEQVRIFDIEV